MSRPAHLGLRHVALNVRALAPMKRFYVDVLGYRVEWEPDADNVYLTSGADNIALHRVAEGVSPDDAASGGRTRPPLPEGVADSGGDAGPRLPEADVGLGPTAVDSGALDHLGLLVGKAEDVDAWAVFLESRGVTLDARPHTHRDGARSLYFRDPDGNRIQIIHHPPLASPGIANR